MSKTLSDLPTDLHQLILSHDEEKIQLKKENEKLKTGVKMLQCLLDEARQEDRSVLWRGKLILAVTEVMT